MDLSEPIAMTDIDWVVLSLERRPERLERFHTENSHLELPVETVAATDGDEVNLGELQSLGLVVADNVEGWGAASIGNALTHWLCWYQAVETQRPICIFEDKAVLRRDFVPRVLELLGGLPAGWEMLQLGYNTDSVIDFEISPDCRFRGSFSQEHTNPGNPRDFPKMTGAVAPLRMHNAFGSFAYIVTPAGAQKLIDECFPLASKTVAVYALGVKVRATSIDILMNKAFSALRAYVCFPPLAQPAIE